MAVPPACDRCARSPLPAALMLRRLMLRPLILCGVMCSLMLCPVLLCPASAAEPGPPGYRVYSETLLLLDRWRGTRTVQVDRTDVRQRLRLDAWRLGQGDEPRGGPRFDMVLDLEVGSDLGPPSEVVDAVPDGRRVRLDLYTAELRVDDAFGVLDARIGRQRVLDAIGFAALDGAVAELWLMPHVTLRMLGGLEVRRTWSRFGPDLYETDDTLLRDSPGGVIGVGARTRDLGPHAIDLAWRRTLDDGGTLRDEIGAAAVVRALDSLDATAGLIVDLIYLRPSELRLGAAHRLSAETRLEASWLRLHPTFAADSIWSAFVTEAHHAGRLTAHHEAGRWRLTADGELRVFDGGQGSEIADGLAGVGGVRIDRAFDISARTARFGLDGRLGLGYGGARHHLDAFGHFPLRMIGPNEPIWMRVRLGAAYFDVPDRDDWDGWAGWLAGSAEWFAAAGVRLDGVVEAHAHRAEAPRVRVMARMTLEDRW